jgi:hypothetical protein
VIICVEEILMKTWSAIRQAMAATVLLVLATAAVTSLTSIPAYANDCPLTQGFWKNHLSAWKVASCLTGGPCLTLGSVTYTQSQLHTILTTPVAGDASLILAHQLIAADLNIDTGSVFSGTEFLLVLSTIAAANSLLDGCTLPCGVAASSPTGQALIAAADLLDLFNSGALTSLFTPSTCIPR